MAFGPQPYVPVRNVGPRAYVPPPQDINTLIANLQAQRVANAASAGPLPLTRTLPGLGSGAGDVSSLYAKPPAAGQLPLTRTLPRIGPGAGDVSNLLAPRALNAAPNPIPLGPASPAISNVSGPNPAASRAIRGGWEYTPTAATPTVPGQQLALGPGSPLPNPPDLPPPLSQSAAQTARGMLGSITSSYVPQSVASRLPFGGKLTGAGGNLLGGMLTSMAAGSAREALANSPYANTELGRAGNEGLFATQYGAFGGPTLALASGIGGATGQLGFASGQGRPVVDTGNDLGNAAVQGSVDTALGSTPGLGTVYNAGKLLGMGAEALGLGDSLSDLRANTLGKIPGIKEFFNDGEEEQPAEDAAPRDYSFNSIRDTATQMGLDPQSTALLEQKYNSTIAYMKGNPVITLDKSDPAEYAKDKAQFESLGYKIDKNDQVQVDDKFIQAAAWKKAYNALPTAQAQALQTADFARKQAALQAALAEQFGTLRDQAGIASTPDYSTWQASIAGLPAGQQAAAQGMLDTQSSWQNRINDAFLQQAAQLPSFLALNQQIDQANSMAAQIQQAQNQQWLAQMYPDLFGQQQSSSGGLSIDDLLAASGG